jgi:hypothetical protein
MDGNEMAKAGIKPKPMHMGDEELLRRADIASADLFNPGDLSGE